MIYHRDHGGHREIKNKRTITKARKCENTKLDESVKSQKSGHSREGWSP